MLKPVINVTPLIDVLLVLLIIFMIVSPLKPSRFEAKIPQQPETDESIPRQPAFFVVEIRPDESLLLNGASEYDSFAELPRLAREIERRLAGLTGAESNDSRVFVKAPKSISYGKVIRVIDSVKTAGIMPLSLQIDDLES